MPDRYSDEIARRLNRDATRFKDGADLIRHLRTGGAVPDGLDVNPGMLYGDVLVLRDALDALADHVQALREVCDALADRMDAVERIISR